MDSFATLSLVLAAILVGGTMACLPLFHWNWHQFVRSSLFIKCVMWIPIYIVLALAAHSAPAIGILLALAVIATAGIEFHNATKQKTTAAARTYFAVFLGMSLCFAGFFTLPSYLYAYLVVAVSVSSALSDVVAFFAGNYLGKHKLPPAINPGKSWEGVVGQVVGGGIGMLLIIATIGGTASWQLGIIVGLASAAGDIINSIAKRSIGIKDWGTTLPGHGGIIDRCSSLFAAFTVVLLIVLGTRL